MTDFRTILPLQKADFTFSHDDSVLCLGSCFAEHIAARLFAGKFQTFLNPSGILFNPFSISRCLELLITNRQFTEADIFEHHGLWHSFSHHGSFSHSNSQLLLKNINSRLLEGRNFLKQTTRLILTLGTAQVFIHKADGEVVANCHKVPNHQFETRRLQVPEIVAALTPVLQEIRRLNKDLQVILTVSPVRYLREGLVGNQRSKAALLLAASELEEYFDFLHYFPSYELVMDDLRDYRFYKEDMAHPTDQAVDYVWSYFKNTYFAEPTMTLLKEISAIANAAAHRPLHPDSDLHGKFIATQLQKIGQLEKAYPKVDFSAEKSMFASIDF